MTNKQKQCLLVFLGYDTGGVDGIWGEKSRHATEYVQEDLGLTVDGAWGAETETAVLEAVYTYDDAPDNDAGHTGTFWDEIEYFTREEFRCKCGGRYCNGFPAEPQEKLVRIADQLRKNLGVPVDVISGLRCETWNRLQGGRANSQHMFGEAMDIHARGKSQAVVEAELDKIGGVRYHYAIKESNNVHFDVPKGNR